MKNQKGFAPVLIIIIIAVVALGVIGYLMTNKNKTGGGITLPKFGGPALNANCELKDPDLCKYVNQTSTGDFMKNGVIMKTTTTDKSGKKTDSVFEIDGKENSRMTSSADGKQTMGFVHMGAVTYTLDVSDGKWWKYENKTDKISPEADKDQNLEQYKEQGKKIAEEIKDNTSYKKIGKEACGSLTCFKYQIIIKDMPDLTEYIYFDDREYLMRKTRTEDKSGMITETTYEYQSVSIKEPSPVKAGSQFGDNSVEDNPGAAGAGMSQEELKKIQESIQNQTDNSNSGAE